MIAYICERCGTKIPGKGHLYEVEVKELGPRESDGWRKIEKSATIHLCPPCWEELKAKIDSVVRIQLEGPPWEGEGEIQD